MLRLSRFILCAVLCLSFISPPSAIGQFTGEVTAKDFDFNKTMCFPPINAGGTAWHERIIFYNPYSIAAFLLILSGFFKELGTVLFPGLVPARRLSHFRHADFTVKLLSARNQVLSSATFTVNVNSDGKIPTQKFQVPGFEVQANQKVDITFRPREGFFAAVNQLKITAKGNVPD